MCKLCESDFFNIYILNLRELLVCVNDSFEARFKNNEFESEEDQNIFEDYIQFLSSYNFDSFFLNNNRNIRFWKETFIPLEEKEKNDLINEFNKNSANEEFCCKIKNNKLILKKEKSQFEINNINIYFFYGLIRDLYQINLHNLDYYLNKNLKPNFYEKNLFIMKTKDKWKELNLQILTSNTIKEAVDKLFNCSYIDILDDRDYISQIMDNIKFFIYETQLSASTNNNSLRIYENGLYKIESKKSESLLSFYAFNSVSNIHEICGHINIRVQNFNSLDNSFDSPTINADSNLYSFYANIRKKESREKIEISIFGKIINQLTTKEALFILEPNNYSGNLKNFQEKFKICNSKPFKEIITEKTIEKYLKPLGININELSEEAKIYSNKYSDQQKSSKIIENTTFTRQTGNHPPQFYYEIDRDFIEFILNHHEN
jgi:hypothetical protein